MRDFESGREKTPSGSDPWLTDKILHVLRMDRHAGAGWRVPEELHQLEPS